ncbi:hypothetical protein Golob_005827 [Gossypium lobatum]|uniref:DUF4283 domain-containing protein n=1 Tax=Gossypium lobatum TaxID=34289 RepID=A0A7J8MUN3_9ROSI|nr:hypothetical protein [Gossypium lobatum]
MLSSSSVSNVDNNGEGDSLPEDSITKKVRFKESNVNLEDVMVVEDSNTKKVRFKESDVIPEDVMVVESSPTPSLSWKDMLAGKDTPDVKKSVVDGVLSIDFSERVYQHLEKEMSTSVVLKMLGRKLRITTLHTRLYGTWKPSKLFQLMDIENGYFLAKFQSTYDYDKILSQGPWVIFGHYLTVQPWTIDFNPSKVTKLDFKTDSKARGRYACMAIYVNLGRPLVSKIFINGSLQRIEYENLPEARNPKTNTHLKDHNKVGLKLGLVPQVPSPANQQNGFVADHVKMDTLISFQKQAEYVVHFNPTFEESSFVNVAVKEGVLEAKNHLAVVLKNSSTLEPVSNEIGGCASDKFLRAFREYNNQYKHDIISLLEPRINGVKTNTIIAKLGWDKSHRVEAVEFSGGIWIG